MHSVKESSKTLNQKSKCDEAHIIPLSHLHLGQRIVGGTFGVVHKGDYLGTDVAIKTVPLPDESSKDKYFLEVNVLR